MSEQITGGAAPFSRGPGGRGDDVGRPIKTKFSNALGSQRGLEGGRSSAAAKTLGTAESRPAIGQHRAMIGDMGAQSAAKLTPRPGSAALGGANLNPVAARALGGDNAKTATNAPAGASGFAAFGDKSKKAGQTEKSGDTTLSTRGAGSGSSRSRAAKSEPEATAASIGRMMKGFQEMAARIAAERPFPTRSRLGGQPAATGEGAETATIGDKETLGQGVGETERSESTLFAANDGETVVEESGAPDERVEQIAGDDASLSAEGEAETEAADEAETAAAPEPDRPIATPETQTLGVAEGVAMRGRRGHRARRARSSACR